MTFPRSRIKAKANLGQIEQATGFIDNSYNVVTNQGAGSPRIFQYADGTTNSKSNNSHYTHIQNQAVGIQVAGGVGGQKLSSTDADHLLSVHRRKVLRRAANRRSAQLSRARKKNHIQDLEFENARLQRLVDIIDSQPDLVFCTAGDGRVTYMSERMHHATKDMPAVVEHKEITHINQLLVPESVQIFFEAINQLSQDVHDNECTSSIKQVVFLSSCGYTLTGALRCAKLTRQQPVHLQLEEGHKSVLVGETDDRLPPHIGSGSDFMPNKKQKKSSSNDDGQMYLSAEMLAGAAAVLSALPLAIPYSESQHGNADKETSSSTGSNQNETLNGGEAVEHEEEYVCVVRVSDKLASNSITFSSSLSKASMRDHDRSSARQEERRGSPSGSTGSGSSGSNGTGSRSTESSACPISSNETKNSTSSETGSDDNGDHGSSDS